MTSIARSIFLFVFIVVVAVQTVRGIKCWVCDGKRTLKACHAQYGKMLECPNADDVCQNDYRTAQGKPLITKGCKQAKACETEVKQNKDKNQCGRKRLIKNMVCRCCCSFSGCNSKESGCLPPPAPCKRIPQLKNGQSRCPVDIDFGSQCFFRCHQGYEMKGKNKARCLRLSKGSKKGRWNPEKLPVCEKVIVRCDPPRVAPTNGFIQCKNALEFAKESDLNYEGSKCSYQCKANYYLKGKANSVCANSGRWNNPEPRCEMGQCEIMEKDPNRIETCTDNYNFGSTCTFSCKEGFNLIGSKRSECLQSGRSAQGQWSRTFPRCAEVICNPVLTNPAYGKVSCTKENFKGSVCTYTCNEGYDLDKTNRTSVSSVCEDDGNGDAFGKWSADAPTCSEIKCEPAFVDPVGGQVVCTNRNRFGSVCTFSCNSQNDLDDTTQPTMESTCQNDENGDNIGKWSRPAAECSPITCQPEFKETRTQKLSCTNGNAKNSVCTFMCAEDYDLDGGIERTQTSICQPPVDGTSIGKWTKNKQPECTSIKCPPQPFPDNGFRICSTFDFMRGTFCVFMCEDGYDLIGKSYMSCQDSKQDGDAIGEWTDPTPTCRLGQCTVTKYDKSTVVEDCAPPKGYKVSEYRVGTVCTYRCISDAYYMVPNVGDEPVMSGETISKCNIDKKWTKKEPRCLKKTCQPKLLPPDNGYPPLCTNGNDFGSKCTFSCQEKHALTQERPLVCEADEDNDQYGRWSEIIPECKRSHCDEFGTVLHGKINCTDGTKIGSVCNLKCIDRYTAKRYEETECLDTINWSRRQYYCCVRCLFNRRLKITAVFDTTAFQTRDDWQYIVDFTRSYLAPMLRFRLDIGFAALTYSDDIDEETLIPMRRLRYPNELDELVSELENMHFGGHVANTGRALDFVNDVIYERIDRRREHFVVLATSGRSRDDVRDASRQLRDRGVNILATGVKLDRVAEEELIQMAGMERNVFTAAKFQDMASIPAKIFEISRTTGCTTASKSQSCP